MALTEGEPENGDRMLEIDKDPMPVFTIKAQDRLALHALIAYREACFDAGIRSQALEVIKAIAEIASWQDRNLDKMKLPDHNHVPARKVQ